MAGEMAIKVDDRAVRRTFELYPEAAARKLSGLIEGAAVDVQRQMRINAPVAVTGALRRSIQYSTSPSSFSARIAPKTKYAEYVEKGTRPHWTSAKPGSSLYKWAMFKGLNPFAVQRSIAKKGTRARPFVTPTYREMKPRVIRDVVTGFARFVGEVNSGRLA